MRRVTAGMARRAVWFALGLGLDFATWLPLRQIPWLAGNPGSAGAVALCWVHAFVLPACFARPFRAGWLAAAAALGLVGTPLAIGIGFLFGLQAGALALLSMFAFGSGGTSYQPPSPIMDTMLGWLFAVLLSSGFIVGAAIATISAVGVACLVPGLPRPGFSWRLVIAGGAGALVFLPLATPSALAAWQQPAGLLAASLCSLILVGPRAITNS